ncbi:PLP-dependent aminotransferase family protein [Pseudomonas oryzihabitans]|uniref:aminotransferase-like domain-containing protein n=1 Tax=Pseudomonas oryzihabitans TaxID=47885 RepID=UPI002866DEAF|nr:PLP-dependent aminotransferase family protein [Pseudomonas psychrotolerans]MDR6680227.1 DNA-binding transcriptional MocR family regulator [Pseudomonas psychrotolerans]
MEIRYRELAENLKQRILGGLYREGQKLPSLRKLSQEYGVSVGTVQNAYVLLEEEGLVYASSKSGYFVMHKPEVADQRNIAKREVFPVSIANWDEISRFSSASYNFDILELGRGMPDVSTSSLNSLMKNLSGDFKGLLRSPMYYESIKGSLQLRSEIARHLIDSGMSLSSEDVIITSGGQEALSCTVRILCKENDIVAIESPAFHGIIQTLKAYGIRVIEVPCDASFGIDISILKIALSKYRISALILNPTCNNPLGFSMPVASREELVRLAAEKEFHIIEDDTYGDLYYAYPRPPSLSTFEGGEKVITLGSFSKTLGPGLRIGWVVPGELYEKILHEKYVSSGSSFTAGQKAIAEFMKGGEYRIHLRKMRERYSRNVKRARDLVVKHVDVPMVLSRPSGGYYLWIEFPNYVNADSLNSLIVGHGIQIGSGRVFSVAGQYSNCIRLNCSGTIDERFESGILKIGEVVRELQAKDISLK